jgi:uncharacterized membrane protein
MKKWERVQLNHYQEYKSAILIITAVSALIVASPAIQRLLIFPQTDFFTELWILGPQNTNQNIPYNITRGVNYNVYLGIANHLGSCAYYQVQVKFRNETQPAADLLNGAPSSMPSLYNMPVFVANEETWESRLTFSFDYTYDSNATQVHFVKMTLNGSPLNLASYSASWNAQQNASTCYLFFELYLYNSATGNFQYHERFVSLRFNMTIT